MTKKDREEHFSEKEALLFHTQGKPGKIEILFLYLSVSTKKLN